MSNIGGLFKMTKFRFYSMNEAVEIQKAAFALGFRWLGSKTGDTRRFLSLPENGVILVNQDCRMSWMAQQQDSAGEGASDKHQLAFVFSLVSAADAHRKAKKLEQKISKKRRQLLKSLTVSEPITLKAATTPVATAKPAAFKRTKVMYRSQEEAAEIQKQMFKMGFRWPVHKHGEPRKVVNVVYKTGILYVDENCDITYGELDEDKWGNRSHLKRKVYPFVSRQAVELVSLAYQAAKKAKLKARKQEKKVSRVVTFEEFFNTVALDSFRFNGKDKSVGALVDTNACSEAADTKVTALADTKVATQVDTNPKRQFGLKNIPLNLWSPLASAYGAVALYNGALKYGQGNYKGTPVEASIYIAAAERHLAAWKEGEEFDPKDGQPHLGGVLACIAILLDARGAGTLIDDRIVGGGYLKEREALGKIIESLTEFHAGKDPKHYFARNVK